MLIKLDECRRLRLAWFMTLWEEPVPREDIWEWHNNCHHLPNRWEFYWQRISLQSCYYVQILNIKQQSSIHPPSAKEFLQENSFLNIIWTVTDWNPSSLQPTALKCIATWYYSIISPLFMLPTKIFKDWQKNSPEIFCI